MSPYSHCPLSPCPLRPHIPVTPCPHAPVIPCPQVPRHSLPPRCPLSPALAVLFAEEPGLVLEVPVGTSVDICRRYQEAGVRCVPVGHSGPYGPDAMVRGRGGHGGVRRPSLALWAQVTEDVDLQICPHRLLVGWEVAMAVSPGLRPRGVMVGQEVAMAMSLGPRLYLCPVCVNAVVIAMAMVVAMSPCPSPFLCPHVRF